MSIFQIRLNVGGNFETLIIKIKQRQHNWHLSKQPLLLAQQVDSFSWDFGRPKKIKTRIYKKIGVCLQMLAILANVDLNLRRKICKVAIQSSIIYFTYPFVTKRRVSESQYECICKIFVLSHRYQQTRVEKLV